MNYTKILAKLDIKGLKFNWAAGYLYIIKHQEGCLLDKLISIEPPLTSILIATENLAIDNSVSKGKREREINIQQMSQWKANETEHSIFQDFSCSWSCTYYFISFNFNSLNKFKKKVFRPHEFRLQALHL